MRRSLSDPDQCMPLHTCEKREVWSPFYDRLGLQNCTCRILGGGWVQQEAMERLRKLKLEFCAILVKLPGSICKLESLVTLNLHGCVQLEQLPSDLGNLKSLEILDLRDCQKLKALPDSVVSLKSLQELDLSGCIDLLGLPEKVGSLHSLRVLRLAECEKLILLPKSICNLDSLSQLDLHGCEQLKELPDKIGKLKAFESLSLVECRTIGALPSSICKLTSVMVLDMNGCSRLTKLPKKMGNMSNLQVLRLAECSGLTQLCASIGALKSLVTLDLQWCLDLKELPEKFGSELESLEFLYLMECQGLRSLPESLCRLRSLKELDVSGCLRLEELPSDIGNLSCLQELRLASCEALKKLPDSVCKLQSLLVLDLYGCYSVEELPREIGELSALQTLNLGKCRSLIRLGLCSSPGFGSLRELNLRGTPLEDKFDKGGQLYLVGNEKITTYLFPRERVTQAVQSSQSPVSTGSAQVSVFEGEPNFSAKGETQSASDRCLAKHEEPAIESAYKDLSLMLRPINSGSLQEFSFEELMLATRNFRPDSLLCESLYSTVYKGWIDEQTFKAARPGMGLPVAVKVLRQQGRLPLLHEEWMAEVYFQGQFHHPHLLKLFGYGFEGDPRLLVYEFMHHGDLNSCLRRRGLNVLTWGERMRICVGVAKALAFLHGLDRAVIYRNLQASKILLDLNFNPKLSLSGLRKDGPRWDMTQMSNYGCAAPESVATGLLTTKSNVYEFGVVLLEILTGRRALDKQRPPAEEQSLVQWAYPYLANKRKLYKIFDSRLQEQYSRTEAECVAKLARRCLNQDPELRPLMKLVVKMLPTKYTAAPTTAKVIKLPYMKTHGDVPVKK